MGQTRTVRTVAALAERGLVAAPEQATLEAVAARFSVAITPAMLDLIEAGRGAGIARQFRPDAAELTEQPQELADPIGDRAHAPVAGIVHRYPDRVLLMPTRTCAVYCRFCFRRESVGPDAVQLTAAELAAALDYIRSDPAIWEVILTGGDPLVLSPRRLAAIITALNEIPHLGVIRIHTRVPAVAPDRITPALVEALKQTTPVFVVLHANHPDELTPAARQACAVLVDAGIPMLSQTVLLNGVNNSPDVLTRLMRRLVEMRIKPYYLHHADLAVGTSHFRTSLAAGQALTAALRRDASGLCQPTYVLDIPGGHGKVPVGRCHLEAGDDGAITILDPLGGRHRYPE